MLRHWLTPNDCRRCEPCDGESEISPHAVISNPSIAWSSQSTEWAGAGLPSGGITRRVKYGQYADTIRQEPMKDGKWEPSQSTKTIAVLYETRKCRVRCDLLQDSVQFIEKLTPQAWLPSLIPVVRVCEFSAHCRGGTPVAHS